MGCPRYCYRTRACYLYCVLTIRLVGFQRYAGAIKSLVTGNRASGNMQSTYGCDPEHFVRFHPVPEKSHLSIAFSTSRNSLLLCGDVGATRWKANPKRITA